MAKKGNKLRWGWFSFARQPEATLALLLDRPLPLRTFSLQLLSGMAILFLFALTLNAGRLQPAGKILSFVFIAGPAWGMVRAMLHPFLLAQAARRLTPSKNPGTRSVFAPVIHYCYFPFAVWLILAGGYLVFTSSETVFELDTVPQWLLMVTGWLLWAASTWFTSKAVKQAFTGTDKLSIPISLVTEIVVTVPFFLFFKLFLGIL